MLYQKCFACHSEWNAIKMVIECPFCGNAFEMQTSNFKSVEETFRYIICTHGFEVIKQKARLFPYCQTMLRRLKKSVV